MLVNLLIIVLITVSITWHMGYMRLLQRTFCLLLT